MIQKTKLLLQNNFACKKNICMNTKSPLSIAFFTSIWVSIVAYFVLFFLLRADIVDTRSSTVALLQQQDDFLQKTLDNNLSAIQEAITTNVGTVLESVVSIVATKNITLYFTKTPFSDTISSTEQQAKVWWWSGIIVSKSWFILTNRHVVQDPNASYTVITHDGKTYPIARVWFDPQLDIAIVQIQDQEKESFVDHVQEALFNPFIRPIQIGQFVFAIGNTLTQYDNTVTMWIVSAKNRELYVKNTLYAWLLQTDAPINPGNSGWPLVDIYGNVIGINTAIDSNAQWVWFALPVTQEFVDKTIESILNYQKIVRPYIGIVYTDITDAFKKELNISDVDAGIYIQDIVADSPAQEAWLLAWDIVIAIDDQPITKESSFLYQLYTYNTQDTIRLHVLRNWDSVFIEVMLRPNT